MAGKFTTLPGTLGFNQLYGKYKSLSKLRFDLTKEQFKCLVQMDCFYCGKPPGHTIIKFKPNYSTEAIENTRFTYNGVDRVDSNKGYTFENCIPCCGRCNQAKMDLSQSDFFSMIKSIYEKHQL